ncbi:MAG: KpsF/GutQ family sugar-phosphate isomerase [Alphaproteobacteria bacterium]|jgi:arabinose-5-phosphate isomerase|nr:KpsF/GutQ family sugar-phosphate isomerase [Alphaproteobacteria bacterium]
MTAAEKSYKESQVTDIDARSRDIDSGRRVLRLEAEGISALADTLGDTFIAALDILHEVKGRVVITGMGKSGHVARKIAATMASTGTPAQYVHPGEASHGDLGMITQVDVVLALSNSGETKELRDLLEYTRRFSIPLIAITGRTGSTLDEMADVTLLLPATPEACSMTQAPTTSTTTTLALGDALAVSLLERKGFSSQDFQVFHPGGKLGQALLRVSDLMHKGDAVPLCTAGTPMKEAILAITAKSFGCVGVLDEGGCLSGVVTDGDLRRHMESDLLNQRACDVMTVDPKTIRPQALAAEAVAIMNKYSITSLFAVEDGRPAGILHIHDCLRAGIV